MVVLTVKQGAHLYLRKYSSRRGWRVYLTWLPSTQVRSLSSSSTVRTNPSPHDPHELTTRLAQDLGLPLFRAHGSQLSLLKDPSHFYETLKRKILSAKSRIVLASLYIGKEENELISSIQSALSANPDLTVTVLVDALRSTREASPSPSCASLIALLHRDFPDRVNLRLYRTPRLRPWLERIVGKRFNEGWGLQHMKIYGFDDDVVISGANLSRDYFTNRRDRYLLIKNHKEVCDYLFGLVDTICRFSYRLESDCSSSDREKEPVGWKTVWQQGTHVADETPLSRVYVEHNWSEAATQSIQELTESWRSRTASLEHKCTGDTLLLPLLQMGPLNIRQEVKAIPQLLSMAQSVSATSLEPVLVNLTSGYFSLYEPYKMLLGRAQASRRATVKIICAAPEANGFYQSKGVSGWIPEAYTWFESQFWKALKHQGQLLYPDGKKDISGGVELKEWKKKGWTYHAKGIWYTPAASRNPADASDKAGPTMVHVGSSNYGSRSSDLDLECTFLISTASADLSRMLRQEVQTLQKDATDTVDETLFNRPERHVRLRVKVAAWFLRRML